MFTNVDWVWSKVMMMMMMMMMMTIIIIIDSIVVMIMMMMMMVAAVAVAVVALPPSQIFLKNVQNHYHHRYPPTVLVTNTLPASSSRLSCQPQPAIGGVGPKGFLRHKTPPKKKRGFPKDAGHLMGFSTSSWYA